MWSIAIHEYSVYKGGRLVGGPISEWIGTDTKLLDRACLIPPLTEAIGLLQCKLKIIQSSLQIFKDVEKLEIKTTTCLWLYELELVTFCGLRVDTAPWISG